ncbi:AIPR family protein [Providencia rustigianii]
MKEQLEGCNYHLFGLLNNGITVICDEAKLNSEELTLVNYQIVNGCQTSNVIFELIDNLGDRKNIFIPVRFIATEDEETKNSIIKGTNSQTSLTQAQLMALSNFQKAIERYYSIKQESNRFSIYYERRTEQYRGDDIPKTKIINIPIQIKCVSALFFNLPHEVSGQYGKVEKSTSGLLFENEKHLSFLNVYYVSGLCWYKVERFVQNHEEGRKFRRARWHIMMLFKLRNCDVKDLDKLGFNKIPIDKK